MALAVQSDERQKCAVDLLLSSSSELPLYASNAAECDVHAARPDSLPNAYSTHAPSYKLILWSMHASLRMCRTPTHACTQSQLNVQRAEPA